MKRWRPLTLFIALWDFLAISYAMYQLIASSYSNPGVIVGAIFFVLFICGIPLIAPLVITLIHLHTTDELYLKRKTLTLIIYIVQAIVSVPFIIYGAGYSGWFELTVGIFGLLCLIPAVIDYVRFLSRVDVNDMRRDSKIQPRQQQNPYGYQGQYPDQPYGYQGQYPNQPYANQGQYPNQPYANQEQYPNQPYANQPQQPAQQTATVDPERQQRLDALFAQYCAGAMSQTEYVNRRQAILNEPKL